jgi:hypothetical protein
VSGSTPSADDVRLLSDHLFYEVQMTFHFAPLLAGARPPETGLEQLAINAPIEAFTIHVRQLIDFLWNDRTARSRATDAFAGDYFAAAEWAKLRPTRPEILNDALRKKIGWGVAHLTYGRARSTQQDKQWDFVGLARGLAPALVCFADHVDATKIEPEHLAGIRFYAERFS